MQKIIHILITIVILIVGHIRLVMGFNLSSIEPELLCLLASSHYEKKYNIPRNLLRSISIVESGKWNSEHKMSFAWPWIVGIDGKGKFFNTYAEAVNFLRKAVAAGENVDIGCHQINWKHHGHNFNKPEDLLHPKNNAAYAAHFLVEKFNQAKSWNKAVAHYHSHTPEFGNRYLKKVISTLDIMKGPNGQKYTNYIQDKTNRIKMNNGLFYHNRNADTTNDFIHITHKKMIKTTSNNKKFNNSKNDIIVFSRDVELPANSDIVEY